MEHVYRVCSMYLNLNMYIQRNELNMNKRFYITGVSVFLHVAVPLVVV